MSFSQNLVIEFLKIIPFLIIGGITVYIAWKQHTIEKSRLNSELSDKKLEILKQVSRIIIRYTINKPFNFEQYISFTEMIGHRYSTCSKELNKKIDELEGFLLAYINLEENDSDEKVKLQAEIICLSAFITSGIKSEYKIK